MTLKHLTFKQFWELTEIYTAPLNLFIILLGYAIANFQLNSVPSPEFFLFVLIIVMFHITVNVFNHYMDYRNASDEKYKQQTNIIGRDHLDLRFVRNFYLGNLLISFLLGLVLVWRTNWVIGVLGIIGFYIGLFYSYGRRPLNSLPIAEALTGTASGFFITVVSYYLTVYQTHAITPAMIGNVFLISLPLVLMMFNNLLANNTCDLEEDIENHRKTLVYYLGKPAAVKVLLSVYVFSFLWLIVLVVAGLAPWTVLFLVFLFPKNWQNLKRYRALQDKRTTFPIVLKAMSALMVLYPVLYFIGSLFA
ncbi:MAG: UbiA family prenyltransferase [Enterococcus sp.]|jgi:1,4-dihydroxy-2-naphthoate octaprenyltransferase|uniref:UbiA family prenyltransferase n=1 Tax=Enterococcus TaxID=1350 RepID=UPI00264891E4|nr:UbiA family prenyltransferase [Enterococcus sp.]MDN6001991.1 UbiA family prenyltransferase [Enterococcus sp.]MDN6583720.1 UbiA family prenyltransferase [Enterococcus sp.]MDN6616109.1 UbiA family prenyltransferase [Enterococcus sp.]MDN6647588.1 UbiA family prenyltransferase [Enterococcus sp.]MDN6776828.1 UbiA family prenyltransferase [Enterococcus sp.]